MVSVPFNVTLHGAPPVITNVPLFKSLLYIVSFTVTLMVTLPTVLFSNVTIVFVGILLTVTVLLAVALDNS